MPRVLLTRPRAQSEAFAATLPAGWEAAIWPVIEIEPAAFDRARIDDAATLIFTSARAVEALGPLGKTAWCVGDATARAAEAAGAAPRDGGGDAETMLGRILAGPDEGPYLHVRGADARVDLAARLRAAGRAAADLVVYRAVETGAPPPWLAEMLNRGDLGAAAFFSPRSAGCFAAAAPRAGLAHVRAVAISAATAARLRGLGFARVEIAAEPTAAAMRAALCGAAS